MPARLPATSPRATSICTAAIFIEPSSQADCVAGDVVVEPRLGRSDPVERLCPLEAVRSPDVPVGRNAALPLRVEIEHHVFDVAPVRGVVVVTEDRKALSLLAK